MWRLKTTTVRVAMGALGTIKKDMENYTSKIPVTSTFMNLRR